MAYITTSEVAQIRSALKLHFPQIKFSVRREHLSSVHVSIMKSPYDFSEFTNNRGRSINQYRLSDYKEHEAMFKAIINIMKTAPDNKWFDDSDAMTDYFHTAFYLHLEIGKWDKEYEQDLKLTPKQ